MAEIVDDYYPGHPECDKEIDEVFATFYPLNEDESIMKIVNQFRELSDVDLTESLKIMRKEMGEFQEWLMNPPSTATSSDISEKIWIWDQVRQYIYLARSVELENKEKEKKAEKEKTD